MEFDTTVHIRNKNTGVVEFVQPYTKKVSKDGTYYIRDDKRYAPNNKFLGNIPKEEIGKYPRSYSALDYKSSEQQRLRKQQIASEVRNEMKEELAASKVKMRQELLVELKAEASAHAAKVKEEAIAKVEQNSKQEFPQTKVKRDS